MNNQLKDRVFTIPDNVFNYINKVFMGLEDKSIDGTQRAKNLLRTKKVSYPQIKRIIHDLENMDNTSLQYNLAGGDVMLDWGKNYLNGERQTIKNNKKSRKRADNIGQINDIRKNPYLSKHTKKSKDYTVPTNMLKSNSDKTSVSPISSLGIFEEVKRFKDLI